MSFFLNYQSTSPKMRRKGNEQQPVQNAGRQFSAPHDHSHQLDSLTWLRRVTSCKPTHADSFMCIYG